MPPLNTPSIVKEFREKFDPEECWQGDASITERLEQFWLSKIRQVCEEAVPQDAIAGSKDWEEGYEVCRSQTLTNLDKLLTK